MRIGNKWADIAKILSGTTDNNIKNRWNATKRKQLSQRKFLPNNDDSNLLQDYIKSVTTPSPPERSALACGGDHKTVKQSLSLSTTAISHGSDVQPKAVKRPQQAPNHHYHSQSLLLAQRPASNYVSFPMVDGNENLGFY
ncbi:transcription factor MYB119-like [Rhodamnia argentea]|uniref:Transcription factor MYB119-like n=1 Tax=Rhodamnia argentea TaxID=178133 RepID=A0A8B8MWY0_9MYRT|nr:transcription factor MYB119-like [Rhodamnia argentea]